MNRQMGLLASTLTDRRYKIEIEATAVLS